MPDQPVLVGLDDQSLMHACGQGGGGKLGKRSREGRFARHGAGAVPAAQPAQRPVGPQTLDQQRRRRNGQHGLGDKGVRQRHAIGRRAPRQARAHRQESPGRGHLENGDEQPLLARQWPERGFEPGEKIALKAVLQIG